MKLSSFSLLATLAIVYHACISPKPNTITKLPMALDGIVRLSKVEVYPEYLEEYLNFAVKVGEVSLESEPSVLTMYGMADKDNPCMITILETYNSSHLTPFGKRAGTRCA